jgi:putative ABC transport system permease protein
VVPSSEIDVAEGELWEGFQVKSEREGKRAATTWYRRQVRGYVLRCLVVRRVTSVEREGTMGWFDDLGGDVRWAVRGLRKRPAFTFVAVATLALGIGANSAIFTLVSAHFFSALPYEQPDELVLVWETGRNTSEVRTVAPGNYWRWREDAASFSDIAAYNVDRATVSGDGFAEGITASVVTPHFFDVLGASPQVGGGFDETSARAADELQVILSHSLWVRRYGSDRGIIGRDIRVDGQPHTVVGVMPPSFRQPERSLSWQSTELWRPMLLEDERDVFTSRYLRTIARRSPGVTVEQAREEMLLLADRLRAEYPEANAGRSTIVRTLDDYLMGDARPTLMMLLAAGAAVLLIVCANVANLTLARGEERRREFAVRAALGSGGGRLVRQVLVEGLVLALLGALFGTLAVIGGGDVLQGIQARFFSGLIDIAVDWRVVALTTSVAFGAGTLFGLPLARSASRPRLREALVEGGERGGERSGANATRSVLIIGQVGMATTLLVLAALLSRSFNELVNVPPGFEPGGVVTFTVSPPSAGYADEDAVLGYHRDLRAEVEAIPGVTEIGMVSDLMFTTENRSTNFSIEGREHDPENPPNSEFHIASPEYFDVLGIPIRAGIVVEAIGDEAEAPVVVNERMAATFWPDGDALGAGLTLSSGLALRVAAVVGNVLDDGYQGVSEPIFYMPFNSMPSRRMSYLVRATGDLGPVTAGLREAVARVDPDIPAADLYLLESMMEETAARPRAASLIGSVFALIALLVSAAGIYGVLSYAVQSRTREIGIRAALGASDNQLMSMVMGHSTRLVLIGLVLGAIGAIGAGTALSGLLFGVRVWDPASMAGAAVLLGGVATFAAWLPARRAVAIDPKEALRAE